MAVDPGCLALKNYDSGFGKYSAAFFRRNTLSVCRNAAFAKRNTIIAKSNVLVGKQRAIQTKNTAPSAKNTSIFTQNSVVAGKNSTHITQKSTIIGKKSPILSRNMNFIPFSNPRSFIPNYKESTLLGLINFNSGWFENFPLYTVNKQIQ